MRCVTRVTAPFCFGANSSFTEKHVRNGENRNSVVVFLVHIKDITSTFNLFKDTVPISLQYCAFFGNLYSPLDIYADLFVFFAISFFHWTNMTSPISDKLLLEILLC